MAAVPEDEDGRSNTDGGLRESGWREVVSLRLLPAGRTSVPRLKLSMRVRPVRSRIMHLCSGTQRVGEDDLAEFGAHGEHPAG